MPRRLFLTRRRFLAATTAVGLGAACGTGDASADGETAAPGPGPERLRYGDHADAFGDLWLPDVTDEPVPVVVLIHGGFWLSRFELDLMDGLAVSAAAEGFAAWNIEYRRVGGGGGWPETFLDVAAAVDHLATIDDDRLDLDRVVTVGHSAGGQLAVWVAGRHRLPPDAPGADPVVRPAGAIAQAGVLDLVSCAEERVGGTACSDLLGGQPADVPDRYAAASPVELLPVGVPVVAVHGTLDGIVPVAQSDAYVRAAEAAGDPAELVPVDGADHFDVIDPDHEAWTVVLDTLDRWR